MIYKSRELKDFYPAYTSKRRRKRNNPIIALIAIFGCVFIVSSVFLARALLEYSQAGNEYESIIQAAVTRTTDNDVAVEDESPSSSYLTVDYAALEARNEDYIAWIDIPNTVISYPVVHADDYWEYLYTTFDNVQNNAGCIFADYQCANDFTSPNTILYGHRMNDGSMFGTLKKYFDADYLEAHREIHMYIDEKVLIYEVFSVYQATAADESYTVVFGDDSEYEAWLNSTKAKSVVDTGVSVDRNDKVLMLSTCKGGDNLDRTVVFAVLKETVPN